MSNQAFDKKLDALRALRPDGDTAKNAIVLRKSLRDPSNFVVAKAAALVAEFGAREWIDELLTAFDRLLLDPLTSDPQCWGKNAIARALAHLGYRHASFFSRALRYKQLEKVWGGSADTAMNLRAICTEALVGTDLAGVEILRLLIWPLADEAKVVRVAAAHALANLNRWEGELLLRQKVMSLDTDPDVLGACFAGILELSEGGAVSFIGEFLDDTVEARALEAVAALAESRSPEAFALVQAKWRRCFDLDVRRTIAISLGASPLDEARDFLLEIFRKNQGAVAVWALTGLAGSRFRAEVRDEVSRLVDEKNERAVAQAYREEFS